MTAIGQPGKKTDHTSEEQGVFRPFVQILVEADGDTPRVVAEDGEPSTQADATTTPEEGAAWPIAVEFGS